MNRATRQALANEESALTRETVLLPEIIAEAVIGELERYLRTKFGTGQNLQESVPGLVDSLAKRAEDCYAANRKDSFGRNLRGRNGREWLYAFMRHWFSGELLHTPPFQYDSQLIPDTFKMGQELEVSRS